MQMIGLEKRFENQKYLSTPDRIQLAESLGLSQLQVKTWYQNRRMKWKKKVLKEGSREAPTKPKGRPKKNSIPSFSDIIRAAEEEAASMNHQRHYESSSNESRDNNESGDDEDDDINCVDNDDDDDDSMNNDSEFSDDHEDEEEYSTGHNNNNNNQHLSRNSSLVNE